MRRIIVLLLVFISLISPVMGDVNQSADLTGGNTVKIKAVQQAWNFGSGDINQDLDVLVTGNIQMVDQDSIGLIHDAEDNVNINNEMKGFNLIVVDLIQYAKNKGSGDTDQNIGIKVSGNIQMIDQDIILLIG